MYVSFKNQSKYVNVSFKKVSIICIVCCVFWLGVIVDRVDIGLGVSIGLKLGEFTIICVIFS